MSSADNASSQNKTIIISGIFLLFTVFAVWLIYSTQPNAPKDGAVKRSAMLVEVMGVASASHKPQIKALGNVIPAQKVSVMPRVEGAVVAVSEQFVPGNFVKKGQLLVKLDASDFEIALRQEQANLEKAKAAYSLEMGEQARAQNDYNALGMNSSGANKALMLREPQKQTATANLEIAQARVEQAKLALERTQVRMPFDGQVLTRDVNLGSQISTSNVIAQVIGTDRYWVEASIPSSQLKWIARGADKEAVTIRDRNAWPSGKAREGTLKQVVAELSPATRMAKIIVEVSDPLQISGSQVSDGQLGSAPLISGAYVDVEMPGIALENSFKVPLKYVRKNNTVWVMQDKTLDIRQVDVAFKDDQYAYITNGLEDGDDVIKTDLARITQGAELRLKPEVNQ